MNKLICIIALLLSCSLSQAQPPDTLRVNNNTFVIDAYAYYDNMPFIGSTQKKGLTVIIWLIDATKTPIPGNIEITKSYAVYKDTVWMYEFSGNSFRLVNHRLERTARNGPNHWPNNAYINVAAEVFNKQTNTRYIIGKPCVQIENVY